MHCLISDHKKALILAECAVVVWTVPRELANILCQVLIVLLAAEDSNDNLDSDSQYVSNLVCLF